MGLDTSHDAFHGAYSAFSRWRNQLAHCAGYAIHPTCSTLDGQVFHEHVVIDWGHVTPEQLMGEWEFAPTDPLMVLIAHHDDGGVIHPEQAGPLADRIAELMPLLPTEDAPGHIGNWRATTQRFVDGLRRAVAAGEDVWFA